MPLTLPHTFVDGPGNIASGQEVMDNFNAVNAGVAMATVTSLPASPVNGQECFYLADATNGVVWHLKYRSASASAYKWECVGGSVLQHEILTAEIRSAATYADLTTVGPTVTIPLAGDYDFTIGAEIQPGGVASNVGRASLSIGGATPVDADSIVFMAQAAISTAGHDQRTMRRNVALASSVAKMQYKSTSTNNMTFLNRILTVRPVRVG